jgi:ribonuclease HI
MAASSEIEPEVSGVLRVYTDGCWLHARQHEGDFAGAGIAYFLGGRWHTCARALFLPLDDVAIAPEDDIAGDNHDAEMLAIALALREVEVLVASGHAIIDSVEILTDSQSCVTRWNERNEREEEWEYDPLTTNEAIRLRRPLLDRDISVELVKVGAHVGITGNELADRAAAFGAHKSRAAWRARGKEWRNSTEADLLAAKDAPTVWVAWTRGLQAATWAQRRMRRVEAHRREREESRRGGSRSHADNVSSLMSGYEQ